MADSLSGVGVLDKAVAVLDAVAAEPRGLAGLVAATGLSRATAHRIAVALERHALLARDPSGRFTPGPRWRRYAGSTPALPELAGPVLQRLRDGTGESTQLYVRRGRDRVCVAAADRLTGLHDSVPVGAVLPLTAGSGAQVLLAWLPRRERAALLVGAVFDEAVLAGVRRRGWARSAAEREPGVGSVSAPVPGPDGAVVAAVCVSGPLARLAPATARRHAAAAVTAARELAAALG